MARSQASAAAAWSPKNASGITPALLTSTSTRPHRSTARPHDVVEVGAPRDVGAHPERLAAGADDGVGGGRGRVTVDVARDDARPHGRGHRRRGSGRTRRRRP